MVKKALFGVVVFVLWTLALTLLAGLLADPVQILGLDIRLGLNLVLLAVLVSLSGGFFAVYMAIADDWRFGVSLLVLISVAAVFLLPYPQALVVGAGTFLGGLIVLWSLKKSLSTYLNWSVGGVLMPSVRLMCPLMFLGFAASFYFASSAVLAEKGFEIPDSLIDPILKMIPTDPGGLGGQAGGGVSPASAQNELIKQTVKSQLDSFIKPIEGYMPGALSVLLYLTLAGVASLFNVVTMLVLTLTFAVLKSMKFVKFATETRQIQKLTVS